MCSTLSVQLFNHPYGRSLRGRLERDIFSTQKTEFIKSVIHPKILNHLMAKSSGTHYSRKRVREFKSPERKMDPTE